MPPKFKFTKDETVNAAAFTAAGGGKILYKNYLRPNSFRKNRAVYAPQGGG